MSMRCVCGKSKTFPLCDGSHVSERWRCVDVSGTMANQVFDVAFTGCTSYSNLCIKLASEFNGINVDSTHAWLSSGPQPTVRVMVLVLQGPLDGVASVAFERTRAINRYLIFSLRPEATRASLCQFRKPQSLVTLDDVSAFELDINAMYVHVRDVVSSVIGGVVGVAKSLPDVEDLAGVEQKIKETFKETDGLAVKPLRSLFISHAVADEALLLPAVAAVRKIYAGRHPELFLCSDGIPLGQNWHRTIMESLRDKDAFVLLLSKATNASHFCSFEVGCAYGLRKCLSVISLDGTLPPAFISQVQMLDVPRQLKQRPWLTRDDVILEGLVAAMTVEQDCEQLAFSRKEVNALQTSFPRIFSSQTASLTADPLPEVRTARRRRPPPPPPFPPPARSGDDFEPEQTLEEDDDDSVYRANKAELDRHMSTGPSYFVYLLVFLAIALCLLPALVWLGCSNSSRPFLTDIYSLFAPRT